MADTHQAAYTSVELTRAEVFDRIVSVFDAHKIDFIHSVNGLRWADSVGEFYYNLDQATENIQDFRSALDVSSQWIGACFDFRFSQWDFELYLFTDNQRENVVLSFPHSLYKAAITNNDIASKWVGLLAGIGLSLGEVAMIDGPEVRMRSADASELFAQFRHVVKNYRRADYFIHTALFPQSLFNQLTHGQRLPETFFISNVIDDYQLATLLRFAQ